mmetsp:Transcript_43057/g.139034  ORF Transcript_43057/g.139034 Transcript_43057/m.139034 type:complete len:277 (-) Transcript_43057:492-1322(-)
MASSRARAASRHAAFSAREAARSAAGSSSSSSGSGWSHAPMTTSTKGPTAAPRAHSSFSRADATLSRLAKVNVGSAQGKLTTWLMTVSQCAAAAFGPKAVSALNAFQRTRHPPLSSAAAASAACAAVAFRLSFASSSIRASHAAASHAAASRAASPAASHVASRVALPAASLGPSFCFFAIGGASFLAGGARMLSQYSCMGTTRPAAADDEEAAARSEADVVPGRGSTRRRPPKLSCSPWSIVSSSCVPSSTITNVPCANMTFCTTPSRRVPSGLS